MKNRSSASGIRCLAWCIVLSLLFVPSYAQIKITRAGNIGIGTSEPVDSAPGYLDIQRNTVRFGSTYTSHPPSPVYLDFRAGYTEFYPEANHAGTIGRPDHFWSLGYFDHIQTTYPSYQYSNRNTRENIRDLENSLEKILSIQGVTYDIIGPQHDAALCRNKPGLLAEDLLPVIPEIVTRDSLGLAVDYTGLIPVLIEAVKEQNRQITALEARLNRYEQQAARGRSGNNSRNAGSVRWNDHSAQPAYNSLSFELYIPETAERSLLTFYNLQGKQILSKEITDKGETSFTLGPSELEAGMYYYALIIDNVVADTRNLVLTD